MKKLLTALLLLIALNLTPAQPTDSLNSAVVKLCLTGSFLKEHCYTGGRMYTNFSEAPLDILALDNYGFPYGFFQFKWETLQNQYHKILDSADYSDIATWDLIRLTNENNVYQADYPALTDALCDLHGNLPTVEFPGVTPGWYYVQIISNKHLSVFSKTKYYFNRGVVSVPFETPLDIYGGYNAVKMSDDDRWMMVSGDSKPDDVIDIGDYVKEWNAIMVNHYTGWRLEDLDYNNVCELRDMTIFYENEFREAETPYPPQKFRINIDVDAPANGPAYVLKAKNITKLSDSYEFDINLEGEFPTFLEQFILTYDTTAFVGNKVLSISNTIIPDTLYHFNYQLSRNQIRIGLHVYPQPVIIAGETQIAHVKLAGTLTDRSLGLSWLNRGVPKTDITYYDPLDTVEPNKVITDSMNHLIVETLSGIQLNNYTPNEYTLKQNYPNPFNPATVIEFTVSVKGLTTLQIFNSLGMVIGELVNNVLTPGDYKYNFSGINLPSGIYFYKLTTGDFTETKKMLLIK